MLPVAPPNSAAPNPIIGQLKEIAKAHELIKSFSLQETRWNGVPIVISIATGIFAAFAYKKINPMTALGAGVITLISIYFSRTTIDISKEKYNAKCESIKSLFNGVAQELRKNWEAASTLISRAVNEQKFKTVKEADESTGNLVKAYSSSDFAWWSDADPIKATDDEKPIRKTFQELLPLAKAVHEAYKGVKWKEMKLLPEFEKEAHKVFVEATRLQFGRVDANNPPANYVENQLPNNPPTGIVVSAHWQALPLQA